jgi:shikimate kinase
LKPIALVGMPGGGKSTVGRHLARRIGRQFRDTDAEIEHRVGCSVRDYFQREGEDRFRELETQVLGELAEGSATVLATGGGIVLRAQNRELLTRCDVIYLHSDPDELFRRLRHDRQRPLLQVPNPQRRLFELYSERDALYRSVAHFVVETGRPSVAALVNMVQMQLELAGIVACPSSDDPA